MSTRNGSSRTYTNRNRPVTACSECSRRKQKCDRNRPCGKCAVRGLGAKCSYQSNEDLETSNLPKRRRVASSRDPTPDHDARASPLSQSKFFDQIGYDRQGANAASALDQLLDEALTSPALVQAPVFLSQGRWADFTRLVQTLPPTEIARQLVEVFFNEANWYFSVLDRYFFDKMHMKWITFNHQQSSNANISPDVLHFAALLLQVNALALQFLPPGHACEEHLAWKKQEERDKTSERFSETGQALMNLLDRCQPTVTSIEADLMRCTWLKNDGRGTEAWKSLGSAVRQAQELGLHLEIRLTANTGDISANSLRALWYNEHKRRLWATIFIWESHMSLQLGRPRMINVNDCTIVDPIDCDFPLEPARTLFTAPGPNDRPSSYTVQLVKYKIGLAIHCMMSIAAIQPSLTENDIVQSLHDDVLEMLTSLPPAMQIDNPDTSWDLLYPGLVRQRLQIRIMVHSFLVELHKPQISKHVVSRQHATDAALGSLSASQELFERSQPHQHKIYTLVFTTIDASIFLAATAIKYHATTASETQRKIVLALEHAVARLRVLEDRNPAATHGGKLLAKCVQKIKRASTGRQAPQHRGDGHDDDDDDDENFPSRTTTFLASAVDTKISPGSGGSAVDRASGLENIAPTTADYDDASFSRDLFGELVAPKISTASWLESMDKMALLEHRFDESDYVWDSLF